MKKNWKLLLILASGIALTACNSGSNPTSNANNMGTLSGLQNTLTNTNSKIGTTINAKYEVIIDGGSKGTRIYLYQYSDDQPLITATELFEDKNSIPLAGFANNPSEVGTQAVAPLLAEAKQQLTNLAVDSSGVNVTIMGTAGMRLIGQAEQAAIWDEVKKTIVASGFKLHEARTLEGQYEGVYSWIDYNYLNQLFASDKQTSGTIEIGGASAQIAYALPESATNSNTVNLTINGNNYNLYSISYLGLGVNQVREKVDELSINSAKNPCYANGYSAGAISGDFNFTSCNTNFNTVMESNPDIDSFKETKNLPGFNTQHFAGLGAIWDTVQPLSKKVKKNPIAAKTLVSEIKAECSLSYSELLAKFTDDDHADDAPTYCSTAVYVQDFLFDKLGISDENIQGFNKFETNDNTEYKYNWTLGYLVLEHSK